MRSCPHKDGGWCDGCKLQYQDRLRAIGAAYRKAKQEKKAPIKQPGDRLDSLLSLAQLVGGLKVKAMLSQPGLRKKQAWRAYYAMDKKFRDDREAYITWVGSSSGK